jgi:hypothetical protein
VRLLWLLYEQHGEEADLGKDAFVAWDVDASLRTELERLIDGRSDAAAAPSILAPLIEPYLVRTPPAERRALAESIARSAARAAPYVVETLQQATGAIVARTERIGEGLLAALNARDRDGALTRALVQGPLEITGQTQTAADAERLAEAGEPSEAADRYLGVAAALDDHQLAVAAEAYRERAAMLLYEADDPARAAPLLVEVGRARARRASDLAGSTVRSLREAPGAVAAVVGGVEALHDWPLDPDGAIAALRAAVDASSGEERIRWLADLVGLMSIFEPADTVLATAGDVDAPLAPGARLELELDLLDAVEVIEGVDEAERRWVHVLDWVDTRAGAAERCGAVRGGARGARPPGRPVRRRERLAGRAARLHGATGGRGPTGRAGSVAQLGRAGLLGPAREGRAMRTERRRKDERRAEKLRQVARRIKHGSSMARRMTPVKRAAHAERQRRRRGP